jgi:hypothetical protein
MQRDDFEDILVDDDAAPAAKEPKDDPIKARLAEIENELLASRRQRDEALDDAYKARQEAAEKEASTALYTASAQKSALSNALHAREIAIQQLQADIANAVEVADGKRAAELQMKLAEAVHERGTLRNGLGQLEEDIERLKSAPAPKLEKPVKTADPFEEAIAGLPSKQREWVRQHKDKGYIKPGEGPTPKLLKAYWAAKAEGLDENSDKFIQYMDRELGHVKDEPAEDVAADASERFQEEAPEPARTKPAAKKVVAAAPVSREASNGGIKTAKGTYRLSAEQTQTAARMGMTPEEYLAGIQEGIKRGKIPASVLQ